MRIRPLLVAGQLAILDGQLEAAVEAGERIASLGEALGSGLYGVQYRANLAFRPLIYLGHFNEALANLDELLQRGGRAIRFYLSKLLVLVHMGRIAEAEKALEDLDVPSQEAAAVLLMRLEAAVLVGQTTLVSPLTEQLDVLAPFLQTRAQDIACPARHLGDGAKLLGQYERARAYYHQGLAICEKVGFRPGIALCRLGLAELLLDHFPAERALEHLDFAIAEFRDMKMQPSLERALRRKGLLKA